MSTAVPVCAELTLLGAVKVGASYTGLTTGSGSSSHAVNTNNPISNNPNIFFI